MLITTGIASTTHLDRHYERTKKGDLDIIANHINTRFMPLLIEHDRNQQVGVQLYGEVFQLEDGEFALGIVSGVFKTAEEKLQLVTGEPNHVWQDFKKYLEIDKLRQKCAENSKKRKANTAIPDLNVADLLEIHLDSTQVSPDGTVYKIKRYIASSGDLQFHVYPKDHRPAHFHVISIQRKIDARFDVSTLQLINMKEGSIANADIKKIQSFFRIHPDILKKLQNEHMRMNADAH